MQPPIRVLRILNRFNLGGPTYNVVNLSAHLGEEFETLLIGGQCEDSEISSLHIVEAAGVRYQLIPSMRRSLNPFLDCVTLFKILRLIYKFKPHIVHTHAAKAGILGRLAAFIMRVPVRVHTFHGHVFDGYFSTWKTLIVKIVERILCRMSTVCVAISPLQKSEIVEKHAIGKAEKFTVIPLGFQLDQFQNVSQAESEAYAQKLGIQSHDFVITIIGRMAPIKRHDVFLRAFAHASQHTTRALRAVLVGDGELRPELEALCTELGLRFSEKGSAYCSDSQVIFTSWEPSAALPLSVSHCVCLSSDNEGTPVSLIEALSVGIPIISTRVGGVEDIVQSQESAVLTEKVIL